MEAFLIVIYLAANIGFLTVMALAIDYQDKYFNKKIYKIDKARYFLIHYSYPILSGETGGEAKSRKEKDPINTKTIGSVALWFQICYVICAIYFVMIAIMKVVGASRFVKLLFNINIFLQLSIWVLTVIFLIIRVIVLNKKSKKHKNN